MNRKTNEREPELTEDAPVTESKDMQVTLDEFVSSVDEPETMKVMFRTYCEKTNALMERTPAQYAKMLAKFKEIPINQLP